MNKKQWFPMGSRADGETELDHIAREAEYREAHSCQICGCFECRGDCEDYEQ